MARDASVQETILVVDDEPLVARTLVAHLTEEGYKTHSVADLQGMRNRLASERPHLILLDLQLPDGHGLDALTEVKQRWPDVAIIVMTGHGTIKSAVKAIRSGALSYVQKPPDWDELSVIIAKAIRTQRLEQRAADDQRRNTEKFSFDRIVAESPAMMSAVKRGRTAAATPASTILLLGESGTGKGLFASAIHYASQRSGNSFQKVTCSAIPEPLLEAELFGHERGAFTDAKAQRRGEFEAAHTGTIFLDEIGDMPLALQAKLLGVIEDRSFSRVGGTQRIEVDVRIIAATHRDLDVSVEQGSFREDLRYRLEVVPIVLPALRDRTDDILPLARLFLESFNRDFGRDVKGLDPTAESALQNHPWPGNVRELRNVMERGMLFSKGDRLSLDDLLIDTGYRPRPTGKTGSAQFTLPRQGISLDETEKDFVRQAMRLADGNQSRAASLLGISRDQMRYRLEKMGMLKPPRRER